MVAALGPGSEKQFQYNPPFAYSLAMLDQNDGSEDVVVGLGNGTLLRFKRKKMKLEEIHSDVHNDMINLVSIPG